MLAKIVGNYKADAVTFRNQENLMSGGGCPEHGACPGAGVRNAAALPAKPGRALGPIY